MTPWDKTGPRKLLGTVNYYEAARKILWVIYKTRKSDALNATRLNEIGIPFNLTLTTVTAGIVNRIVWKIENQESR